MAIKQNPEASRSTGPRGTFIDLFAGCGGLSLGLLSAEWRGLFAIEKEQNAFETLKYNLIENREFGFEWPCWLPKAPCSISKLLSRHGKEVAALRGTVDLVAGGPPCQGFSFAGLRRHDDPRNRAFKQYIDVVKILRPQLVLFENVKGIATEFGKARREGRKGTRLGRPARSVLSRVQESLESLDYIVFQDFVNAWEFGVPQLRPRHFLIGVLASRNSPSVGDPFALLRDRRADFLRTKGLPTDRPVSVKEALSDLETAKADFIDCEDYPGFRQIKYARPLTRYQALMHGQSDRWYSPNSLRLPKHHVVTLDRFAKILATCTKGVGLRDKDRERLGIRKRCIVPLDPDKPSHTLTTLPDDFLHYSEPRILTVREYARLQSFPDWFAFKGKYTTGGKKRKHECPRYTQVGNAVPPLLAEALARILAELHGQLQTVRPLTEQRSSFPRDCTLAQA